MAVSTSSMMECTGSSVLLHPSRTSVVTMTAQMCPGKLTYSSTIADTLQHCKTQLLYGNAAQGNCKVRIEATCCFKHVLLLTMCYCRSCAAADHVAAKAREMNAREGTLNYQLQGCASCTHRLGHQWHTLCTAWNNVLTKPMNLHVRLVLVGDAHLATA